MFAIAKYIPEPTRRAVVARFTGPAESVPDCCPLGCVLEELAARYEAFKGEPWELTEVADLARPHSDDFAQELVDLGLVDEDTEETVMLAANVFAVRWDNGSITDLAKAFGVETV